MYKHYIISQDETSGEILTELTAEQIEGKEITFQFQSENGVPTKKKGIVKEVLHSDEF